MVLSLAAKVALIAGIPLVGAAAGGGVFYAVDGSLEATVMDLSCHGMSDPADDAVQSKLLVKSTLIDLDGWYDIPNNVCHTLDVGDVGRVHVQSRTVALYDADGSCKWHSETGFRC